MFVKLLARDVSLIAIAALAWPLASPLTGGTSALSDVVGVLLGLLLGLCALQIHEWGHLLGALATRSAVQPGASLRAPFIFTFDSRRNSRAQFLVMSFTGFAATALVVWIAYALLPSELLASRVARGAVVFLAFLGVVLEVPLVVYALVTSKVPPIDNAERRRAEEAAT